ncbi:hypothetical protein H310_11233 [Aphanomyces invadans]|uniref:Uncharacterized protein n=1 Tax=Aphanomyces invadans TaxID=157072 RepID=A0A024TMW7_9STRA|nr:hypothetical protein H310_11233 [Aphanomyces invadans]ETV95339.1 hypothetical protein H310_11233 [Aphanomyces invadans]|eukprot:XP_008876040.1 hypothetical protein H310_11233 [Aphanomyces invadans]
MHQDADLLSRAVMWTEDSTIPLASPFVECNHGGAINFAVQGIKDQAVVDHPLVLLEGNVDFPKRMPSLLPLPSCSVLYVRIQYIVTLWAVTLPSGHFKALIHLPSPGLHFVKLWSPMLPSYRCLNSLLYRPPLTSLEKSSSTTTISPFRLRFTLQTCPDTNGTIDAPLGSDNSLTAALSILQFNAILLQTIMAQLQSAHHLPPHTFAFDSLDALGQPVVDAWSTPELTTSTMAALDDQEIFRVIRRELNPNATDSNLLHVVVTGCCRYNAMTRRAVGHAAVGADGTPRVALFGGCGLHAWASSVHDVVKKLTDTTRIPSYLMDDSGHRGTMGGLYTTGLGALLHEMGHAFGLGHSPPGFIMSRGGDDLHRVLSLFGMDGAPLKDMGGARWHRTNAIKLHHSPFLRRESPAHAFAAGLAYMDGPQRPFKVSISKGCIHMGLLLDIGDVRIAPDKDGGDDMLFCLATGEVVVAVTVHAVAWVDGIQLHTSTRSTQVFGHANDVPPVRLAAPHGMAVRRPHDVICAVAPLTNLSETTSAM